MNFVNFAQAVGMTCGGGDWGLRIEAVPRSQVAWDTFCLTIMGEAAHADPYNEPGSYHIGDADLDARAGASRSSEVAGVVKVRTHAWIDEITTDGDWKWGRLGALEGVELPSGWIALRQGNVNFATPMRIEHKHWFLGRSVADALWDKLYNLGEISFPGHWVKVPPLADMRAILTLREEVLQKIDAMSWESGNSTGLSKGEAVAQATDTFRALAELIQVHGSLAAALTPEARMPITDAVCDDWDGNGGHALFATDGYCFELKYDTS